MAGILKKKPKSPGELLDAIIKIASDKNQRLLLSDENEWLELKLKEIARCGRKLKRMNAIKKLCRKR